jgi:hypothetical protein
MSKMFVVRFHGIVMGLQLLAIVLNIAAGLWFVVPVCFLFIILSSFFINMALRTMK